MSESVPRKAPSILPTQLTVVAYAIIVFAGGVWRQLETAESPQAVWFGGVLGLIAILGAALLSLNNKLPGMIMVGLSLLMVGGWFWRRFFTHATDGHSPRVMMILAAWALTLAILIWRQRKHN